MSMKVDPIAYKTQRKLALLNKDTDYRKRRLTGSGAACRTGEKLR